MLGLGLSCVVNGPSKLVSLSSRPLLAACLLRPPPSPRRAAAAKRPHPASARSAQPPNMRDVVQQRSQRLAGVTPARPLPPELQPQPRRGLLQNLVRVVAETFLVARLAVQLFGFVGFGYRWIISFVRLVLFALLLLPGFLQMMAFYFFSPRVRKSIRYGPNSRNLLDLYLPPSGRDPDQAPRPLVVYVTGGAWTIGHRAWGAMFSRRLSKAGVLVASIDYRNAPQGTALDMVEDLNHAMGFVFANAQRWGGDPDHVFLCGQSCGGHLASLAVLTQAEQQALGQPVPGGSPAWDCSRLKSFVGISGVFNVADLVEHFDRRGLYKGLFLKIMSIHGEPQLKLLSPVYVASHCLQQPAETAAEQLSAAGGGGESDEVSVCSSSSCCSASSEAGAGAPALLEPLLAHSASGDLAAAELGQLRRGHGSGSRAKEAAGSQLLHAESAKALHGGAARGLAGHDDPPHSSASSLIGAAWGDSAEGGHAAAAAEPAGREGGGAGPDEAAARAQHKSPAELMPPCLLLHGDADRCAPVEGAEQFAHALEEAGVDVELKLYPGETHTSPLLENPMRGGQDALADDILSRIWQRPVSHHYPQLCPAFLINLASWVCPF